IVACASGVQYAAPGDDMLGIIPALFFAGARSTVSTLWPVNPQIAVNWTKHFIEEWRGPLDGSQVDLALYARRASLALLGELGEENIGDWAAYVYHGWSQFPFVLDRR